MIPAPSLPGTDSSLCLAALHALPPTCPFTRNAPSDLSPGNKGRQLSPARRQLGHCFPSARLLWKLHPVPDLAYHYVPTQASLPSCPPISPAACWTPSSLRCLKPNLPKTDLDIFTYKSASPPISPLRKGPVLYAVTQAKNLQSSAPSNLRSQSPLRSVKNLPFTALCPQGPGLVSSFQSRSPGLLQQTLTSPALTGVWTGGETWTPPGLLAVKALRGDERHPSPHHSMRARLRGES